MKIIGICNCGAIAIDLDGERYSMKKETFEDEFPDTEIANDIQHWINCDHCINHWGIDLCSCGSGETPKSCDCGSKKPMQDMKTADNSYRIPVWAR